MLGSDGRLRILHRNPHPPISLTASGLLEGYPQSPWEEIFCFGLGTTEEPRVLTFASSMDGKRLATTHTDGSLRLLDLQAASQCEVSFLFYRYLL